MDFHNHIPKSDLEKTFLKRIDEETPEKIKKNVLFDLNDKNKLSFVLKKAHLEEISETGEGLGINSWFESYKKEAMVSTAGIRGLQNPLYPWDTRYPMNILTIALATLGKAMVANESDFPKFKISACETRYNSSEFVELIARIQAVNGIKTYVTEDYKTMPIFLISFIIFMFDLYGGEYVTSSHALAKKIATKDLNSQGSQYMPAESLLFVKKIEEIIEIVKSVGQYEINISSNDSSNIDRDFLKQINNGINKYVEYLKTSVATEHNLNLIKKLESKVIIDCAGGSMTKTFGKVLKELTIDSSFEFIHKEEDPFHHEIGKLINEGDEFFDWGCDATIMKADLQKMKIKLPVIETMKYDLILKDFPVGTLVLITDPDADRLITSYIEIDSNVDKVESLGLAYQPLNKGRMLVLFTPNQSFLMTIDFQKRALESSGLWKKYDWFVLKTTASQLSWDQWAEANNVQVINTPVGFKELQDVMMSIERQILEKKDQILIRDVTGKEVNLGKNPRLLFGGEESGGEIFGPHELIKSKKGRIAISMREKSAGEAIIITSALFSWLSSKNMNLTDYLLQIFDENKIKARFEIRVDNKYYNESEPDIKKLLKEKEEGINTRTQNDMYFLSVALAFKDKIIDLSEVKKILSEAFPDLDFNDLQNIYFVGDGTYLLFSSKCVEVRPSGTDAMNKAYSFGDDRWESVKYAQAFSSFEGKRNDLHKEYIKDSFYENIKEYSFKLFSQYKKDLL